MVVVAIALMACGSSEPLRPKHRARLRGDGEQRKARRPLVWGQAYTRMCLHTGIHAPVLSLDGQTLLYCSALFEAATGRFLRPGADGVFAFISNDEVVKSSNNGEAVARWSLSEDSKNENVIPSGHPEKLALSPRRDRMVSLERGKEPNDQRVVVRAVRDASVIASAPVEGSVLAVGFTHNGRPLVATDSGLFSITEEKLTPLGQAFDGMLAFTFSANGSRAVLTRKDGSREVVAMPSGQSILPLPPVPDTANLSTAVTALSPDGSRVALIDSEGVVIFDVESDRVTRMDPPIRATPVALVFSPDGRGLAVTHDKWMTLVRQSAVPRPLPAVQYDPEVPKGFVKDTENASGSPDQVAHFHRARPLTDVRVTVVDPREFDTGQDLSLDDWKNLIMTRENFHEAPPAAVWEGVMGRVLEYTYFRREGCLPADVYVRMIEQNKDVMIRIEVEVPPGTAKSKVVALLRAFWDEPLGAPIKPRVLATPSRLKRSGC
jgi:hypothetical protein